jgi:hypothetical protein
MVVKEKPTNSTRQRPLSETAKASYPLEPEVIILPNSDFVRWSNFNKAALLKAVAKEPPEERDRLIDEFQEKWNEGKKYVYLSVSSISLYLFQSVSLYSIYLYLSICLSLILSVSLCSIYLYLSICLSLILSVYFFYLSICHSPLCFYLSFYFLYFLFVISLALCCLYVLIFFSSLSCRFP